MSSSPRRSGRDVTRLVDAFETMVQSYAQDSGSAAGRGRPQRSPQKDLVADVEALVNQFYEEKTRPHSAAAASNRNTGGLGPSTGQKERSPQSARSPQRVVDPGATAKPRSLSPSAGRPIHSHIAAHHRSAEEPSMEGTLSVSNISDVPDRLRSGAENEKMYRRGREWQWRRSRSAHELRRELDDEEMKQCTFTPYTNKEYSANRSRRSASSKERFRAHDIVYNRELESLRAEVEAERFAECTFQPVICERSRSAVVHEASIAERSTEARENRVNNRHHSKNLTPECTFRPRTNSAKYYNNVDSSISSRSYSVLSTSVFDRLHAAAQKGAKRSYVVPPAVVEELKAIRLAYGGEEELPYGPVVMSNYADSEDELEEATPPLDASAIDRTASQSEASRLVDFKEFLVRQNKKEEEKRMHIHRLKVEGNLEHQYEPKLCDRSKVIAPPDRQSKLLKQPNPAEIEAIRAMKAVEGLSFKPELTEVGRRTKARSVEEMLKDADRARRHKAKLVEEKLRREKESATFQPKLNTSSNKRLGAKSVLAPACLQQYADDLKKRDQRKQELSQKQKSVVNSDDLGQCTFRPVITQAPAYVRRMAGSMQIVRGDVS